MKLIPDEVPKLAPKSTTTPQTSDNKKPSDTTTKKPAPVPTPIYIDRETTIW